MKYFKMNDDFASNTQTERKREGEKIMHKDFNSNEIVVCMHFFFIHKKLCDASARLSNNTVFCCDEGNTMIEMVTRYSMRTAAQSNRQ